MLFGSSVTVGGLLWGSGLEVVGGWLRPGAWLAVGARVCLDISAAVVDGLPLV